MRQLARAVNCLCLRFTRRRKEEKPTLPAVSRLKAVSPLSASTPPALCWFWFVVAVAQNGRNTAGACLACLVFTLRG